MPRSRHLAAYPHQFFDLAEAVAGHARVELSFATRNELERLRLQWYGFVRAALAEAPELGRKAQATICRITQNPSATATPWILVFENRDDDPVMLRLSQALPAKAQLAQVVVPEQTTAPEPPYDLYTPNLPISTTDSTAFEDAIESWLNNTTPADPDA